MHKNRSLLYTCRLLCLICTGTYLSACFNDDSDIGVPQTLLTLDPQTIPYLWSDNWVYATDSDGNILDVKRTVGRERLILSSVTKVDKFNLNIVSGSVGTNG